MSTRRRTRYDENLLVELLARDHLSQREIARRVGVSESLVSQIASGRARPDLHERIGKWISTRRDDALRAGQTFIRPLLMTQLKVAMEEDGETARKCREFLLNRLLFAPPDSLASLKAGSEPPMPMEEIPGLEKKDIRAFYEFLGDREEVEETPAAEQRTY
jgi:transcriptional regulator with XRE-family HTH domain